MLIPFIVSSVLCTTDVDPTKWQILYLAKLKACHKIADFSDAKKDVELKEAKKECLIEIIDVLDEPEAADYIIKERVLEAAMEMISANLFRTFANKSKCYCLRPTKLPRLGHPLDIQIGHVWSVRPYIHRVLNLNQQPKPQLTFCRFTLSNIDNKKSANVDPDEDEPHLEEAWPHL